jgi:hypothetical protein
VRRVLPPAPPSSRPRLRRVLPPALAPLNCTRRRHSSFCESGRTAAAPFKNQARGDVETIIQLPAPAGPCSRMRLAPRLFQLAARHEGGLDDFADAVPREQVQLLDARGGGVGGFEAEIGNFGDGAAVAAREG